MVMPPKIVTHYEVSFSVCSYIRFWAHFLNLPLKNPMLKIAKISLICIAVSKCNEQNYEIDRPDRKKLYLIIVCYDVRKKWNFFLDLLWLVNIPKQSVSQSGRIHFGNHFVPKINQSAWALNFSAGNLKNGLKVWCSYRLEKLTSW